MIVENAHGAAWSPEGKQVAFARFQDSSMRISAMPFPLTQDPPVLLVNQPNTSSMFTWSK